MNRQITISITDVLDDGSIVTLDRALVPETITHRAHIPNANILLLVVSGMCEELAKQPHITQEVFTRHVFTEEELYRVLSNPRRRRMIISAEAPDVDLACLAQYTYFIEHDPTANEYALIGEMRIIHAGFNWAEVCEFLNNATVSPYKGWRWPTEDECESLVSFFARNPRD